MCNLPWNTARALCLLMVLLLTQCVDQQSKALKQLAAKGYSLSVPEFFKAASAGDVDALKLFFEAGVAPDVKDAEGLQAINHAARAGKSESLVELANLGATMPEQSSALLSDAVHSHAMPALNALLELHVKPEPGVENSPLATAASETQREMLEALLPLCHGHEDAALLAASAKGEISVISTLLRSGASVFARDTKTRRTPLMEAASMGHEKAVQMLLDAGANRWAVDAEGFIAGEAAQAGLHAELAKKLFADPSAEEQKKAPSMRSKSLPLRPELVAGQLFFTGCREVLQPFELVGVTDKTATVQMLKDKRTVKLDIGAPIPDTTWKLDRLKLGGAIFRGRETGERLMLVPGNPVRYGPQVAVIQDDATKLLYEAAPGDTFATESDAALHFTVKSVGPLEVVINDDSTPVREWTLKLGGRRW